MTALSDEITRAVIDATASLSLEDLEALARTWALFARPDQLPPDSAAQWTTWLIMAGRGWGKTRTVCEFAHACARSNPRSRGAIVGRTIADARDVLVEGESGLLATAMPGELRWISNTGVLRWRNGARAKVYTAEEPDQLRGPQFHWGIGDEVATWVVKGGYHALDMLRMGLRLGRDPKLALSTTPRPTERMRELLKEPGVVVTRGSTFDNAANLAAPFLSTVVSLYQGTALGAQELDGDMLSSVDGALWSIDSIHATRVSPSTHESPRAYSRVLVSVDPAMTSTSTSDEVGIIAVAVGPDSHGYVLEDASGKYPPNMWLKAAEDLAIRHGAPSLLVEDNAVKDAIKAIAKATGVTLPIRPVTASMSKLLRAQPVAALYSRGLVHHVGEHVKLEHEMATWVPTANRSPNRIDALVHGLTELRIAGLNAVDTPTAAGADLANVVRRAQGARRPRLM